MYCTLNFNKLCIHSKCSHLSMHCHISILIFTKGDACPSGCSKSSECSAAGGVVGGFVGGILMTAVVAAVIFVVFAQRIRSVHVRIFVQCSSLLLVLFLLLQN